MVRNNTIYSLRGLNGNFETGNYSGRVSNVYSDPEGNTEDNLSVQFSDRLKANKIMFGKLCKGENSWLYPKYVAANNHNLVTKAYVGRYYVKQNTTASLIDNNLYYHIRDRYDDSVAKTRKCTSHSQLTDFRKVMHMMNVEHIQYLEEANQYVEIDHPDIILFNHN